MRALYLYGAMMVTGVLLMLASSYKVLNVLDEAKSGGAKVAAQSGVQSYVLISYIGVGMFVLGALGAMVVVLRSMNRR
jgi:hypothetical protein